MKYIKHIVTTLLLGSLALTSCDDAELANIIALGAKIKVGNSYVKYLECPAEEGQCAFEVESNVEYEARIISGEKWLRFADSDQLTTMRNGNGVLTFNHNANTAGKRRARVVLSADTRHDTIDIRQHGIYEDYLKFVDETQSSIKPSVNGGDYCIAIETSELDEDLKIMTDNDKAVTNLKIDNRKIFFTITPNESGIPRVFYIRASYVDGWNITRSITISLHQPYI